MRRGLILSLVCMSSVLIFLTQTTSVRLSISVNEAETRFFFRHLAPEVSLVVVNSDRDLASVVIALQLIDPQNKVLGKTEPRAQLKPGSQQLPFVGGTSFSFKFKPRMPMKAKAAASVLYDHYNPEARVVIPPGTFFVK